MAGLVAVTTIPFLAVSDDMLVTPSPDPQTVVHLIDGPRGGCGRRTSVWDARTASGEIIIICDHSGRPGSASAYRNTTFETGDHVAVGPGSFWQLLEGRAAVLFLGATIARVLAWLGSCMVPSRAASRPGDGAGARP